MAVISPTVQQKREAARYFAECLLKSDVRDLLAKMILFGSVAKGTAGEASDVDVLIIGTHELDHIRDVASDVQFETYERYEEGVEYLVYPLEKLRYASSYFPYRALRHGEELYGMDKK